jgi:starch phosphorylase
MDKKTIVSYQNTSISYKDIVGFDSLSELALDVRSSWNHAADELWQQLDSELWKLTHNPWIVLQSVSRDRLEMMLADSTFRKKLDERVQTRKHAIESPAWFQQNYPQTPLTCIAYFSMEFMLSEALPIYSGGLGNVAGDQLKAAGDLGLPVIGIGLLYQQGYFHQVIDKDGNQQELYPYNDPGQLPVTPLRLKNGEWLRLEIALPGYSVWLRAWQVQVGRLKLYLLDSNDAANLPAHRGITSELYGGGHELRLKQELVLALGGWRLLAALGIHPEVCHLNEGHAAFAVLERARTYMEETGLSFNDALMVTRAGNIFTTHTAVAAGFDLFSPFLIEHYLGDYAKKLGISISDLLALGRINPNDLNESFNMAYLAIRGCGAVNGVSRLHGKVSRHIFSPLFSRWPEDEVPVGHITNGVHMSSWDSAESDALWTSVSGKGRWLGKSETLKQDICSVPDHQLWEFRTKASASFVKYIRERLAQQLSISGTSDNILNDANQIFNPNALTLGFARRFASYKRPNLLLHDKQRLHRILTNTKYPVQLIIAGKAHPDDGEGHTMIRDWIQFIRQPETRSHVIFLSDYDMLLTEHLAQGVDVWINTPRRPWEACGTSGMKVLVNGGLNLSELDGWWSEAYTPEVGWALGDGNEHGDDPAWDAREAEQLYDLLEQQVVPEFFKRNEKGIPVAWISRMRESMAQLTPRFSADRAVREYTGQHYLPAAKAFLERAADKSVLGKQMVNWRQALEQKWSTLHFGEVKVETRDGNHMFDIKVHTTDIDPKMLRVELYANGINGGEKVMQEMKQGLKLDGTVKGYSYSATVSATRPAKDYTARILPNFLGLSIPLELNLILWQH